MTHHSPFTVLYLLTLLLVALAPVRLEARTPGLLEGTVSGAADDVLANVDIYVDNFVTGAQWHTQTDAKGHFVFGKLNPGRYELRAEAKGLGCVIVSQIIISDGDRVVENIHFTSKPPAACEPERSIKPKHTA